MHSSFCHLSKATFRLFVFSQNHFFPSVLCFFHIVIADGERQRRHFEKANRRLGLHEFDDSVLRLILVVSSKKKSFTHTKKKKGGGFRSLKLPLR